MCVRMEDLRDTDVAISCDLVNWGGVSDTNSALCGGSTPVVGGRFRRAALRGGPHAPPNRETCGHVRLCHDVCAVWRDACHTVQ